jgi:non-specific serine/threonine protein kinase
LVVDNCEHLIAPVADLVAHLLAHTTDLRIVATSREPLHVRGETVYHLPTLPVPDPDDDWETLTHTDSVRLFAERPEAAHPGFRVTHDNGDAVPSICRHLDGIPLAVELAAATTRMFTPEQIGEWLDDRFRLLTGGSRDDLDHHHTLEATIDWSYQLLSPEQQMLFARLAVFAGSFTLDAAEQVCADDSLTPIDVLGSVVHLADSSLLEIEPSENGVRYDMLETIRAYATARFDEQPEDTRNEVDTRHFEYCLSLAEEAIEGPISADSPPPWLATLDAAAPDYRQALKWAVDTGHDEHAIDLAGALGFYLWFRKRMAEAIRIFRSVAIRSTEADLSSRIRAMRWAALFLSRGRIEGSSGNEGLELSRESVELARETGDPDLLAAALYHLGSIDPDLQESFGYLFEGLRLAEASGNLWLAAFIRHIIALGHRDDGSIEEAKNLFQRNLDVANRLSDDRLATWTLGFLGSIACTREGDFDRAVLLLEDALARGRGVNDLGAVGNALLFLGQATYYLGDLKRSRAYFTECDDVDRRLYGTDDEYAWSWLGLIAYDEHDLQEARWRLKVALEGYRRLDSPNTWDTHMLRRTLWTLALVLAEGNQPEESATLIGASESASHTPARRLADGTLYPPWFEVGNEESKHLRICDALESTLSTGTFDEVRQQGAAMTLDEATDYALNLLEDA